MFSSCPLPCSPYGRYHFCPVSPLTPIPHTWDSDPHPITGASPSLSSLEPLLLKDWLPGLPAPTALPSCPACLQVAGARMMCVCPGDWSVACVRVSQVRDTGVCVAPAALGVCLFRLRVCVCSWRLHRHACLCSVSVCLGPGCGGSPQSTHREDASHWLEASVQVVFTAAGFLGSLGGGEQEAV